jgi:hypothetical protein
LLLSSLLKVVSSEPDSIGSLAATLFLKLRMMAMQHHHAVLLKLQGLGPQFLGSLCGMMKARRPAGAVMKG